MSHTVRDLAEWVGGEIVGDGSVAIRAARTLNEAGPGDITFVDSDRNLSAWQESQASAAVVSRNAPVNGRPLIRVADPLTAFATIVMQLRGLHRSVAPGGRVDPTAHIHPTARIGAKSNIGPYVVIGEGSIVGEGCSLLAGVSIGRGCKLGDGVLLHPHVVIYDDCVLGNRVIVHSNSVIGSDGFGYRTQNGKHIKTPQLGRVELGDDVEIGACTTIDRGTFTATTVGTGTKIDNLVQIAHNCRIGEHNLIVSQVGIAGSCTTGSYVVMAGQVGIGDHIEIGDKVVIGAQSGVHKDIASGSRVLGSPTLPDREQMKVYMVMERLPEMRRDLRKIKEHLGLGNSE